MNLVKLAAAGTSISCRSGATYVVSSAGVAAVTASPDIQDFIAQGFQIQIVDTKSYITPLAPLAANKNLTFSSAALSNGTLTIAAQPSVMRPLQAVVIPGTLAITAGNLAMSYVANDGSSQVDNLSLVVAASTNLTLTTTKGVASLTSQIVTALAGGASPTISIGTNANLALPMPQVLNAPTLLKETLDGTIDATLGTTVGTYGVWTPNIAPDATHTYAAVYSVAEA